MGPIRPTCTRPGGACSRDDVSGTLPRAGSRAQPSRVQHCCQQLLKQYLPGMHTGQSRLVEMSLIHSRDLLIMRYGKRNFEGTSSTKEVLGLNLPPRVKSGSTLEEIIIVPSACAQFTGIALVFPNPYHCCLPSSTSSPNSLTGGNWPCRSSLHVMLLKLHKDEPESCIVLYT